VSNQLKQTNNTQNARAVLTASSWADQVVQAQVHVNGAGFSGNGFVAVYGRFNGFNDTYYLTLRNTKLVELKRVKTNSSGTPVITTYGSTMLGTLDLTQPHLLRLEIQGNKLRGWVDGTQVLSGSDNDDGFASGRAAVGAYLAEASFDNVFASPLRLAAAKPDMTDDFDDNEASGWVTTEAPGTWAVTTDPTGSSNRVLTQSNATAIDARATAPAVRTDQSTQARVKGTTFTSNGFMAVFARYQDFDNSYYLLLRNSSRTGAQEDSSIT
jgi:hypothetical protein